MKVLIALACFVAVALAANKFPDAKLHVTSPTAYNKDKLADMDQVAFWTTYLEELKDATHGFTIAQIAKLCVALFDSAAGEIDDIFPDQSLKLAIYQVSQIFSPSQGTTNEQIVAAYAAVVSWGASEAQAAALVDLVLVLTNRAFHHFIVNDQQFETAVKTKHDVPAAGGPFKDVADGAIRFVLGYARKSVKICYGVLREEIVEGTDSIILCEAFAYATRGFPLEADEIAHDKEKKAFFREIIDKVATEAKKDIAEFVIETGKAVNDYRDCIVAEAAALNDGFGHTLNKLHAGLFAPKGPTGAFPKPASVLPFDTFLAPTAAGWAAVGPRKE